MRTRLLAAALAFAPLAGCQTIDQTAEAEATLICTQNGYGPGTQYHSYCVDKLKPAAAAVARRRAFDDMSTGIEQIGRGMNPPQPQPQPTTTCVQTGRYTNCY